MNDIQRIQLDLLQRFIAVCAEHHLRYYLFGGSCLGAIRHQGFIPWDDDIDIAMPRPDFNKLMALHREFDEPCFLQNARTDRRYSYSYAKLRHSETCYKETVFALTNMNHGIWIDIFPLDGMSKKHGVTNVRSLKPYLLWFRWYFSYLGNMWHRPRFDKLFLLDLISNLFALLFLPFAIGNWNAKCLSRSCQRISFNEATLVGPYMTMYFNREALPFSVFGNGTTAKFEGLDVKVPADFDTYLKRIYGDYMTPPKQSKQNGHHHMAVSTTISYRKFR